MSPISEERTIIKVEVEESSPQPPTPSSGEIYPLLFLNLVLIRIESHLRHGGWYVIHESKGCWIFFHPILLIVQVGNK